MRDVFHVLEKRGQRRLLEKAHGDVDGDGGEDRAARAISNEIIAWLNKKAV